jgi:hypothetical protein
MRPAIAAMPGPLVFIFLLAKGLRGRAFKKEASLYLVVSAGLLAILLTAAASSVGLTFQSRRWRCCQSYSACTSDNICAIAPEAFKKLVLIAVIAAGAELLRHGFFS